MSKELVSAATILATSGAGTWLADKLLGPSFNALGEQFQAFAGSRLKKVFANAETKNLNKHIEPLPPGFALKFLEVASFSEDNEIITEMWANLLLGAASEFSNKHASYLDTLSQINSEQAKLLNMLIPDFAPLSYFEPHLFEKVFQKRFSEECNKSYNINEWVNKLNSHKLIGKKNGFEWPILITHQVYLENHTRFIPTIRIPISEEMNLLEKHFLIRRFNFELDGFYIEAVYPTAYGAKFMDVCRGVKPRKSPK